MAELGQLVLANAGLVEEAIQNVRAGGWESISDCAGVVAFDKHKGLIVMELGGDESIRVNSL